MSRRIFVSYSHDDRAWRDAFRQMLGPALERFGIDCGPTTTFAAVIAGSG